MEKKEKVEAQEKIKVLTELIYDNEIHYHNIILEDESMVRRSLLASTQVAVKSNSGSANSLNILDRRSY